MDLGPHAAFIIASYLAALAVVLLLILWVVIDRRQQQRMIARLEAQGVVRRSERTPTTGDPT